MTKSNYANQNMSKKGVAITCNNSLINLGGVLLISPSIDPTLHFPAVEHLIEYCHPRRKVSAVGKYPRWVT